MTIRQLEKRCSQEIQAACEKYTIPALIEKTEKIWEKYAGLIAKAKEKKQGNFLSKLATNSLIHGGSHERPILDARYREKLVRSSMGAAIHHATSKSNRGSCSDSDCNKSIMEAL